MKIARLRRIIEQLSDQPMDKQKEAISDFSWNGKGVLIR